MKTAKQQNNSASGRAGNLKKRITSLILALSMVLAVMPVFCVPASAETTLSGKGTADDPYLIKNATDLNTFRTELSSGAIPSYGSGLYFKLTNDIPSLGTWTPIAQFNGFFDGRNHTISGINVNVTYYYVGFFTRINNATIKNLHLEGTVTGGNSSSRAWLGGLAAFSTTSKVSNCSFDGTVTASAGTSSAVGGLISRAQGSTVTNCWTAGTINSIRNNNANNAAYEGPIVSACGAAGTLTVSKCYSSMNGSGASDYGSAGLTGYAENGGSQSYTDCFSTGTGWTRAFVGNVVSGRKLIIKNCHVYNTQYKNVKHGGAPTITNTYQLWSSNTTSDGVYRKKPEIFQAAKTQFTGWNFNNTWKMNSAGTYPILQQYVDGSFMSRSLTYYDSSDNEFNLPDYFDLILSEDKKYNQDGRFQYTVTATPEVTPRIWDSDTWSYTPGTTADLATTNSDKLVLKPDAPVGTYQITVKAHDTNTTAPYADFEMTFTITKKERVPVPEVLNGYRELSYSSTQTLDDIKITDGWEWKNLTQVPKNTGAGLYISSYDAFYELDSSKSDVVADYAGYYDWSDVDDDPRYTVVEDFPNNRILVKVNPLVKTTDDSPVIVHIYVEDEDIPGYRIKGATVKCSCGLPDEFPKGTGTKGTAEDVTDANGYVYAELAPGKHRLTVTAANYDTKSVTETVYAGGDKITIKLKRASGSFNVPQVYLRDANGDPTTTPAPDARVTFTKIQGTTTSWVDDDNNPLTSVSGNSGDPLLLPAGGGTNVVIYKVKSSTYRCSTDDTLYLKFDSNGAPQYYTDEACTQEAGRGYLLATMMDDPVYLVDVDEVPDTDPQQYKVTIDIKYIKATYGTFGLTFDSEVFDFNAAIGTDVILGTDPDNAIASLTTVEDTYRLLDPPHTWKHDKGYYAFIWHSDNNNPDKEIDAELDRVNIATLYFTLKSGYTSADASVDWFGIIPWGSTEAAKAAVKDTVNYPDEADMINQAYWREVDIENSRIPLGYGRIESGKAVVNNVNMKGFFQSSVNADPTDTEQSSYFFDVMTELTYNIDIVNSIIQFHVFDSDDTLIDRDLEDAAVDLFDKNHTPKDSKTTNHSGIARFNINTSSNVNGYTFEYNVSKFGYWPIPEGSNPAPQISAPTGVVTKVPVELTKKIYHKPVMLNPTNPTAVAIVGNADLGGEKYAYNNRPFHFRCKAAKGYRITKYPSKANVYIIDYTGKKLVELSVNNNNTELTPDALGMFTLDAKYLDQVTLQSLTEEQFARLTDSNASIGDPYTAEVNQYGSPYDRTQDPTADPDGDGFRSYNVYIEFDDFEFEELEYKVEGRTNGKGTVTYDDTTPTYTSGKPILTEDDYSSGDDHYCLVKTTKDDLTTTTVNETNHQTGTFTFTATGSNKIEKVYINGLRTYIYDGETSFSYTFGDVDMDCNITVLFYDGTDEDKDKDSLVTLVVGEYGEVETFSPEAEEHLSITRRVYLMNSEDKLKFEATPDNGYDLFKVEKETETSGVSSFVNITSQALGVPCTISPEQGKNVVVYVTFNNPKVQQTPNVFVKSYVYRGMGVADPAGILIYTKYDTVEIGLSTNAPYSAKGVVLQPFDDLTQITSTYDFPMQNLSNTYTYPSLTDNITIGSVFAEKTYTLTGIVNLDQNSRITTDPCQTGATVRFVRLDSDYNEKPNQMPYIFATSNDRTTASFTADIPAGDWNVYIEKPGYLTYKIIKFEMNSDGSPSNFGNGHAVIPYIGSTTNGKVIFLPDAANVKSGWRNGVNSIIKSRADVDDDGNVGIYDMTYVWKNYNQRMITQEYSDFERIGSVTNQVSQ